MPEMFDAFGLVCCHTYSPGVVLFPQIAKLLGFLLQGMSWICAFWSGHLAQLQGAAQGAVEVVCVCVKHLKR